LPDKTVVDQDCSYGTRRPHIGPGCKFLQGGPKKRDTVLLFIFSPIID